jgi:hypothetical protein
MLGVIYASVENRPRMLSVVLLNAVILIVVMLSVVMRSVMGQKIAKILILFFCKNLA